MNKSICAFTMLLLFAVLSCTPTQETTDTTINGHVYYLDQNFQAQPVSNALVYAKEMYAQTNTDSAGAYRLTLSPNEDEMKLTLVASKVGYDLSEVQLLVSKGQTVQAPDISLKREQPDTIINPVDTATVSGPAAHISVDGSHKTHVYIQGSGLQETALINFLITDAQGIPIDDNHQVNVHFTILNGPDGGEYLYPESMNSNKGRVYTILNTGTVAGVIQIEASADVNGKTIRALPIRMSIYGGLPDKEHFSLVASRVNIAGRVHYGILDKVTAYVGDKYSNPVAPGTAVYFTSDYGIIEGSAVTDEMGRASLNFMSASPLPPNPIQNPFAHIYATTYSDTLGRKEIQSETQVLLSDRTASIVITPATFTYTVENRAIAFNYTVSDIYGYPIIGESSIQVNATDGSLYGDVSVRMPDTQISGSGTTEFGFVWAPGDSLKAPQVYINVVVSTPEDGNGYQSASVVGVKTD